MCNNDNSFNCKCRSISNVYDELYDKLKIVKEEKRSFNRCSSSKEFKEDEDENEDDDICKNEHKKEGERYLKCTLDLAGFNSMSQPNVPMQKLQGRYLSIVCNQMPQRT